MARTAMEEAMAMLRSERISGAGEREGGRQRAPPNPGSQSQRDSQHSPGTRHRSGGLSTRSSTHESLGSHREEKHSGSSGVSQVRGKSVQSPFCSMLQRNSSQGVGATPVQVLGRGMEHVPVAGSHWVSVHTSSGSAEQSLPTNVQTAVPVELEHESVVQRSPSSHSGDATQTSLMQTDEVPM